MEGKREFCICKKFRASEMAFLARFCLKNNWHFWQIWLIGLRNAHFLVLWKHSSQSYGHFGTFTPKNGKLTISPQSPILTQISLLGLWTWHFRSYLSNKDLNNISVIFGSWITTQFSRDPALMPTVCPYTLTQFRN